MLKYYYFRTATFMITVFYVVWAVRYGKQNPEMYSPSAWLTVAAMVATILAIVIYASSHKKGWVTIWAYAMLAAVVGSTALLLSNLDSVLRLLCVLGVGAAIWAMYNFSDEVVDLLARDRAKQVPDWDELDEQSHQEDAGLSLLNDE